MGEVGHHFQIPLRRALFLGVGRGADGIESEIFPQRRDGIVVVRGIGGKGAFWKLIACDDCAVLVVPVGDAEAGDVERCQMRTNVFRHAAEVLANHFAGARSGENGAQPTVTIGAVGLSIFCRFIIAPSPLRQASACAFTGLLGREFEKFGIASRTPRKGVDAVESEDVVDAEQRENFRQLADALLPPREALLLHQVPAIERNAPVLAPALDEAIMLEHGLRGSAAEPLQVEKFRLKKDIGGVIGNANRDVAHQLHSELVGESTHLTPLAEAQPLHPDVEFALLFDDAAVRLALLGEVITRVAGCAIGRGPLIPAFAAASLIHQPTE